MSQAPYQERMRDGGAGLGADGVPTPERPARMLQFSTFYPMCSIEGAIDTAPWAVGPYPFRNSAESTATRADENARRGYFSDIASAILYGAHDRWSAGRFHLDVEPAFVVDGFRLRAMELVVLPPLRSAPLGQRSVLLQHWEADPSDCADLDDQVTRVRDLLNIRYGALVGPVVPASGAWPNLLGSMTTDTSTRDMRRPFVSVMVSGSVSTEQMLCLATLTPGSIRRPSSSEIEDAASDSVQASADWQFLVRKDGAVFAVHDQSSFKAQLAMYASSIYLDAMLHAYIGARILGILSVRLGAAIAAQTPPDAGVVADIDRDAMLTRANFGAEQITTSQVGCALSRAVSIQLDLARSLRASTDAASDLVRYTSILTEQEASRAAAKTNASLSFIAVVGLPVSAALTIWAGLGGGPSGLVVALLASILASVGLALAVPGLRNATRDLH